jgi:proteasome lid subunit RPN8/RPN11
VVVEPRLIIPRGAWLSGLIELRRRGAGVHESGAFLLGRVEGPRRIAERWVYYDELDPNAYSTGVCVLYAEAFDHLWSLCRQNDQSVVADVHTHPGAAGQSQADRENPMVASAGHMALIVPTFARGPVWRHRLGVYRYEGAHRWTNFSGWSARRILKTGTIA